MSSSMVRSFCDIAGGHVSGPASIPARLQVVDWMRAPDEPDRKKRPVAGALCLRDSNSDPHSCSSVLSLSTELLPFSLRSVARANWRGQAWPLGL
jgi:hypothetical protein